jgi:hypothetical protein
VPFVPGDASARRSSARADAFEAAGRVAELVRHGVLSDGDPRALAGWLDTHEPIRTPAGTPSAVEVLLTMRRESAR